MTLACHQESARNMRAAVDGAVSCIVMPARLQILSLLVGFSVLWMGTEGRFVVVYPWLLLMGLPLVWSWMSGFEVIP